MDQQRRHSDDETRISPVRARQGRLGWPVLYVLIGGLALAILAWIAIDFWLWSMPRG